MPGEIDVEKPQGQTPGDAEKAAPTPAASKSVVGIIYPPPEVRSILHKVITNPTVLWKALRCCWRSRIAISHDLRLISNLFPINAHHNFVCMYVCIMILL